MEKVLRTICCFVVVLLVSTVHGDGDEGVYARCKIRPTTEPGKIQANTPKLSGTIVFKEKDGATTISGKVSGFTSAEGSKHGFHIHKVADVANDCSKNEGHFNPMHKDHGAPDAEIRHVGDLGNIVVDANGMAMVGAGNQNTLVKLTGSDKVIGKSIVIHEGEDDLGLGNETDSLTTGHAGGRLACCLIEKYEKVTYTSTCEIADNTLEGAETQGLGGTITFTQDLNEDNFKTTISGTVTGFNTTDGQMEHGFHIHKDAAADNNCKNNGGHYNPLGLVDGHAGPDKVIRHYGDLGNIVENNAGNAPVDMEDDFVELFGEYKVVGRSIVVHVGKDDLGLGTEADSKKTGAAGERLACCKISEPEVTTMGSQKLAPFSLIASLTFVVIRRVLF